MGDLNFWQFLVEFFLLDFVSWRSTRPEVLCKSCSEKCCKTRRKTLALESFLNIPLQALEMFCHHRCFPVIFDDNEFFLMIMNSFCGMVDWQKAVILISCWDCFLRSNTPQPGFKPAQDLNSELEEENNIVLITTIQINNCS